MAKSIAKVQKGKFKEAVSSQVVLASLEKKATPILRKLKQIDNITSQETFNEVAIQLDLLKALDKEAIAEEKGMTDGIKKSLKAITDHFKPFHQNVANQENGYKLLMKEFLVRMEAKQKKLLKDVGDGKVSEKAFTKKEAELRVTSGGGASIRKIKKLNILDEKKIPREYLMPDESAIRAALLEGKKVAGCEMRDEQTIAI